MGHLLIQSQQLEFSNPEATLPIAFKNQKSGVKMSCFKINSSSSMIVLLCCLSLALLSLAPQGADATCPPPVQLLGGCVKRRGWDDDESYKRGWDEPESDKRAVKKWAKKDDDFERYFME